MSLTRGYGVHGIAVIECNILPTFVASVCVACLELPEIVGKLLLGGEASRLWWGRRLEI